MQRCKQLLFENIGPGNLIFELIKLFDGRCWKSPVLNGVRWIDPASGRMRLRPQIGIYWFESLKLIFNLNNYTFE